MKVRSHKCADGHTVEYWYDPSAGVRVWYCMLLDADGNQVGSAEHRATRPEIMGLVAWVLQLHKAEGLHR